jgi:hypothetical protein
MRRFLALALLLLLPLSDRGLAAARLFPLPGWLTATALPPAHAERPAAERPAAHVAARRRALQSPFSASFSASFSDFSAAVGVDPGRVLRSFSDRSAAAAAADACDSSLPTAHSLSSGAFGIGAGAGGPGYAHAQSCRYIVKDAAVTAGGTIGVAFTFFHTEANEDVVKIYDHLVDPDGAGAPLATYSGDLTAPLLFARPGVRELLLVFTSDEQLQPSSRTLQLGFTARAWAAAAACFDPACGGHGTCETKDGYKQCACAPDISAAGGAADTADWYLGATCATKVPHLAAVRGTAAFSASSGLAVGPVAVGAWSYYWVDARKMSQQGYRYLVDFKDTGAATSDPLLVIGLPFTRRNNQGAGSPTLPTLNDKATFYEDYFSWYYDRSDTHYIHFDKHTRHFTGPNVDSLIVGIYNTPGRAKSPAVGRLNLRTNPPNIGSWPCVRSCSGHGLCERPGRCRCTAGWYGNGWNSPDTCAYEVIDITAHLDKKISTNGGGASLSVKPIRIGAWAYFKLDITDASWVGDRTVAVDFSSLSPHAQPLVVVRRGAVPHLRYGYLPTYDAFDFDFGDQNGFEVLQGQRQNIVIPPEKLQLGTYYIGIYDIWGHTALPEESHDDVNYTMYVSKYQAGVPCPKGPKNRWCSGITRNLTSGIPGAEGSACNFNTGVCDCPDNALGLDCSMEARELVPGDDNYVTKAAPGLQVKSSDYFYVSVTAAEAGIVGDKSTGKNLVIDLVKLRPGEKSFPVLLARKGAAPYGTDRALFDDHDYVSRYHESESHRILLDKEELTEGTWYFSVVNEEDPDGDEEPLTYKIRARFLDTVACLSSDDDGVGGGAPCSGHGTCDAFLGRCFCNAGFTGDDCGDNGPYELVLSTEGHAAGSSPAASISASAAEGQTPPIPVDEWSYYAVAIGCNTSVRVTFATTDTNTRPLLVLEKDRLPLMVDSTHEYDDYYSGVKTFGRKQVVEVHPCVGEASPGGQLRCFIHPLFPGTAWRTGSPEPGVWYIGIYNDPNVGSGGAATSPITRYTLMVEQLSACTATCAEGFRDASAQCQTACPGLHPEEGRHVFSNTPMPDPLSCSGHGTCSEDGSTCTCDAGSGWSGKACGETCPGKDATCSGHGVCVAGSNSNARNSNSDTEDEGAASAPRCACAPSFAGPRCERQCVDKNGCSGHGVCGLNDVGTATLCSCHEGFAGVACELICPKNKDGVSCGGRGKCTSTQAAGSTSATVQCDCEDGFVGGACGLKCPTHVPENSTVKKVCSGQGTCVEGEGGRAVCACFEGKAGNLCNDTALTPLEASKLAKTVMSPTAVGVAVGVSIASVLAIGGGCLVYRRNQARLKRYEVTFGKQALLAAEESASRGAQREHAASLAAEDVLAQGALSIQMQGFGGGDEVGRSGGGGYEQQAD